MTMFRHHLVPVLLAASAALLWPPGSAQAQGAPAYVIPGRLDVPVMINGVDASWGVVEGDWGLYRPGRGRVVVYGGHRPPPGFEPEGYFPSSGKLPRVGRDEVVPKTARRTPRRAESYHRSWSAGSDPVPLYNSYPPYDPPEVIEAPRRYDRRW